MLNNIDKVENTGLLDKVIEYLDFQNISKIIDL